jgi:hypothetical protein
VPSLIHYGKLFTTLVSIVEVIPSVRAAKFELRKTQTRALDFSLPLLLEGGEYDHITSSGDINLKNYVTSK